MVEKLVQCIAIVFAVLLALLTGNAFAHLQYEQVIRLGSAGLVMLLIALWGAISKGCECPVDSPSGSDT